MGQPRPNRYSIVLEPKDVSLLLPKCVHASKAWLIETLCPEDTVVVRFGGFA